MGHTNDQLSYLFRCPDYESKVLEQDRRSCPQPQYFPSGPGSACRGSGDICLPIERLKVSKCLHLCSFLATWRVTRHLKPYQATWKKLRMQLKLNHPAEGLVINPDDPILNPTPYRPPSSIRQYPITEPVQPELVPGVAAITQNMANIAMEPVMGQREMPEEGRERRRERSRQPETTYGVISQEEDMRRLFEECEIARDNCRILADSLVYATPEGVTVEPVIQVGSNLIFLQLFRAHHSRKFTGVPDKVHKIARNYRRAN